MRCKFDTEAGASVISSKMLNSLKIPTRMTEPSITTLRTFGGKIITPIGKLTLAVDNEKHKLTFHVVPSNDCTVLGKSASEDLGYVRLVYVVINKSTKEEILEDIKTYLKVLAFLQNLIRYSKRQMQDQLFKQLEQFRIYNMLK